MRILRTTVAVAAAGASLAWGLAQAVVPVAASGTVPRAWGCFATPIVTPASGLDGGNVVAGDFAGNHTTDLLVSAGSGADLWLGDGTGKFVEKGVVTVPGDTHLGIGRMVTGDFNKDGSLDFATTAGSSIVVMLNDGHGNFQATSYPLGFLQFPGQLATADLRHNGVLDLVASLNGQLVVLLGNPASPGTFGTPQYFSAPGGAGDLQIGDVDGDGYADIVWTIPNGAQSEVAISYGDGSGAFAGPPKMFPASAGAIGLGDFNSHGDGRLDIVTSGTVPATYPYTELINEGNRTFVPRSIPLTFAYGIRVADINADGHLDFVVGRPASFGGATVELGNGDGTFRAVSLGIGTFTSALVANIAGDLQRDRGQDIVVIDGTDINVLLNQPCGYHPLPPSRILDTRNGIGHSGSLGPGQPITLQVAGQGGVPSSGVAAVVMNVTVDGPTAGSYLTIWPTGAAQPVASNLNWVAGETVPNLVEVALGDNGQVSIYNAAGSVDVISDVAGYVAGPGPAGAGLFNPLLPARIMDTRDGTGGHFGRLGPNKAVTLQVTGSMKQGGGASGVPSSGVSAVVLNATVTNASGAPGSYLTLYPSNTTPPVASNLNFVAGQTVPNRVVVKLSSTGQITIYNAAGFVDVIIDVGGWFTDGSNPSASGSSFAGLTPDRILDTRSAIGNHAYPLGPQLPVKLVVAGQGGVPAGGASAVVLNVTVTGPTQGSYLTVYPDDASSVPTASDLNYVAGQTVPNLVVVKLGADGGINIFNAAGSTHVVVDVVGWYG